jgi:hypothetical protein
LAFIYRMASHPAAERPWPGNSNQSKHQQNLMNNPSYYSPESVSLPTPPQTTDEASRTTSQPLLHSSSTQPQIAGEPQHDQLGGPARGTGRTSVALACIGCRSRHLKCDAVSPTCSRCYADGRQCFYLKSRRGYKGPKRSVPPKSQPLPGNADRGDGSDSSGSLHDG